MKWSAPRYDKHELKKYPSKEWAPRFALWPRYCRRCKHRILFARVWKSPDYGQLYTMIEPCTAYHGWRCGACHALALLKK